MLSSCACCKEKHQVRSFEILKQVYTPSAKDFLLPENRHIHFDSDVDNYSVNLKSLASYGMPTVQYVAKKNFAKFRTNHTATKQFSFPKTNHTAAKTR